MHAQPGLHLLRLAERWHEACLFDICAGIACAAVDTSATAITASLFKGSGYFGTVMGISECMMSLG